VPAVAAGMFTTNQVCAAPVKLCAQRVRGGSAFVMRIDAGTVRTAPAEGQEVDCVISLNACSALMIGYARESVAHALITGGTSAFGRRPWLGLRMRGLFLGLAVLVAWVARLNIGGRFLAFSGFSITTALQDAGSGVRRRAASDSCASHSAAPI